MVWIQRFEGRIDDIEACIHEVQATPTLETVRKVHPLFCHALQALKKWQITIESLPTIPESSLKNSVFSHVVSQVERCVELGNLFVTTTENIIERSNGVCLGS